MDRRFLQPVGTASGTKATPPYANFFMGPHEEAIQEPFIWVMPSGRDSLDVRFPIFLGTTKQLQSMKDFMSNLHPTIKFTFKHSTKEISFQDMKIHITADCKLSTIIYRKPTDCATILHFHSNQSLKCKESIVFSQGLRHNLLIADDALLQKELSSLAVSLLAAQYPLEIITCKISKALLHSCDNLLYGSPKAASPKTVLLIVLRYSPERRYFSQLVRNRWHIIEDDPLLQNVWSSHPITAYHRNESLKDKEFYPSKPHLSMGTHLFMLVTLYATWVAPPTSRPPLHYQCHVVHCLLYHIPPTFFCPSYQAYQTIWFDTHTNTYTKRDILNMSCFFTQGALNEPNHVSNNQLLHYSKKRHPDTLYGASTPPFKYLSPCNILPFATTPAALHYFNIHNIHWLFSPQHSRWPYSLYFNSFPHLTIPNDYPSFPFFQPFSPIPYPITFTSNKILFSRTN